MDAVIQIDVGGQFALTRLAPIVDDQIVVHIHAHAVVHLGMEAIPALIEVNIARPAHGEVVRREVVGGRTPAPVEVNRRVVALKGRRPVEIRIAVVGAAPFGIAARAFIPEAQGCHLGRLVILDAHQMRTRVQALLGAVGAARRRMPLVDHQVAIHPHAHTVIGFHIEAVGSGGQIKRLHPPRREVIRHNARRRRRVAPVEVNAHIIAHELGRAAQRRVVVELAAPPGNRAGARRRGGRGDRRRLGRRHHRRHARIVGIGARQPAFLPVAQPHKEPCAAVVLAQHSKLGAAANRAQHREERGRSTAHIERRADDRPHVARTRRRCRRRGNAGRDGRGRRRRCRRCGGRHGCHNLKRRAGPRAGLQ